MLVRARKVCNLAPTACVFALTVFASGCGNDKQYQFQIVTGHVLKGEQPVAGGTIRFNNPDDANYVASSPIGQDGSFALKTSTTNPPRTSPGAPEGTYEVVVSMPPPEPNRPFPSLRAPETYTIVAGSNDLTVKLP